MLQANNTFLLNMPRFLSIILFIAFNLQMNAQCPFERENCTGECGRFIDENKDGFCDFGLVTKPEPKSKPDLQDSNRQTAKTNQKEENKRANQLAAKPAPISESESIVNAISGASLNPDTAVDNNESTPNTLDEAMVQNKQTHKKPYDFLSISSITIALYIFSMLMVKMKKLKKTTHRKIWNLILLISFLVSGILGLILVIQINYGLGMSAFRDFLFLHVEFGIVMAIIAVIHAFWHLNYYVKVFSKNKSTKIQS